MIRIATAEDVPAMLAIYAPHVLESTCSFEYEVPSVLRFTKRFSDITSQCPWLVWEEQGQVLGYAYGSIPFSRAAYAWCAEVSIYLSSAAMGRGVGRRLYTALEQLLFLQGYRLLHAHITQENHRSLAFHEKMGYRAFALIPACGLKFGRWLDVIWMEKRSKTVDLPTHPPIPWMSIVEDDRKFRDILANLSLS